MADWKKQSISQLQGWTWDRDIPTLDDSSYVEYNFYVLRDKPIEQYTADDVCFMIQQQNGLAYFIPIAIDLLSEDMLLESGAYPGDLLHMVLMLDKKVWQKFPDDYARFFELVKKNETAIADSSRDEEMFMNDELISMIGHLVKSFLALKI